MTHVENVQSVLGKLSCNLSRTPTRLATNKTEYHRAYTADSIAHISTTFNFEFSGKINYRMMMIPNRSLLTEAPSGNKGENQVNRESQKINTSSNLSQESGAAKVSQQSEDQPSLCLSWSITTIQGI